MSFLTKPQAKPLQYGELGSIRNRGRDDIARWAEHILIEQVEHYLLNQPVQNDADEQNARRHVIGIFAEEGRVDPEKMDALTLIEITQEVHRFWNDRKEALVDATKKLRSGGDEETLKADLKSFNRKLVAQMRKRIAQRGTLPEDERIAQVNQIRALFVDADIASSFPADDTKLEELEFDQVKAITKVQDPNYREVLGLPHRVSHNERHFADFESRLKSRFRAEPEQRHRTFAQAALTLKDLRPTYSPVKVDLASLASIERAGNEIFARKAKILLEEENPGTSWDHSVNAARQKVRETIAAQFALDAKSLTAVDMFALELEVGIGYAEGRAVLLAPAPGYMQKLGERIEAQRSMSDTDRLAALQEREETLQSLKAKQQEAGAQGR